MIVEFRLLQVVLSAVSGDRITVALLHWDRTRLRVASSLAPLGSLPLAHREGIRTAVEDWVRQAKRRAREIEADAVLDTGLAHVFSVREGMGAALYWAPVTARETSNAEAHFLELRREVRLDREPLHRATRLTNRKVFDGLVSLGERLKLEASAWVRTSHLVSYKMKYEAPLSWKNGSWHHAVPVSLDTLNTHAIDDEIRRVCGLVELSFPPADVAVLVAAMPSGAELNGQAGRDLRTLRLLLKPMRAVDVVAVDRRERGVDLTGLEKRVRRDLQSH